MNHFFQLFFLFLLIHNGVFTQEYENYKKLLDTTISSKSLGFEKNIAVIVPFNWQKDIDREFPLILIFDSQNERSHNYMVNTIDYLTSNDQMPASIIISVESEQQYRYLETLHKTSSDKGLALENEKFIFEELIPLAENQFNASDFRILIGHSRYGYFTSSLLFSRLNDLNAIVSLSPFFYQKNIDLTDSVKKLEKLKLKSTKYYRFGIGNDYPDDFQKMDSVFKTLKNSLINAKGMLFSEASHNVTPGLIIATALYEIFEEYAKIQNKYLSNDFDKLKEINEFEKELTNHYGSKLVFSLGVLNGKGWYFYNEGKYNKAIEAWEIVLKSYPNFSEVHLYILDAQMMLNKDFSKQEIDVIIDRFKISLSKSNIYSDDQKKEILEEIGKNYE